MFGFHHRCGACFRCFAFVLLLGVSSAAFAQEADDDSAAAPSPLSGIDLDDDAPVLRRPVEPEDDAGLRLGSFKLSPRLEIGVIGTSNAGGSSSEDAALALRPALTLASDWSRHSVRVDASADVVRYLDNGALDSNGLAVSAATRIDMRRTTQLEFDAGYGLSSTAPSDIESLGSPVDNQDSHRFNGEAALSHDFGGLTARLRLAAIRQTYDDVRLDDGTTEFNGDRDFVEGQVALRATLNTAAHIRPFAEVAYVPRRHDLKLDRNGLRRDSHGVTGAIGVVIDDDPVWSGEVAVRSVLRDYVDPGLTTQTAIGLVAALQWQPRDSTTVEFAAGVDIADGISATRGGTRSWNFAADITQALRDNIDITFGASVDLTDALAGTDVEYSLSAGVDWAMTPIVTGRLGYEGNWLDATAAGDDSTEHRVLASIILAR